MAGSPTPVVTSEMVARAEAELAEKDKQRADWEALPYKVKRHLCETQLGGHQWRTLTSDEAYPLPSGQVCVRCNTAWRGL